MYLDLLIPRVDSKAYKLYASRKSSKQFLLRAASGRMDHPTPEQADIVLALEHGQAKQLLERDYEFLTLNERVLAAVSKGYLLLGEEYRRCLQRKHWDQVSLLIPHI